MSASAGVLGFPTVLTIGAAIANCLDVKGPNLKVDMIDITSNSSDSEMYKEYMAGMIDGGEISFDILFSKAAYATLFGYLRTKKTGCTLVTSDSCTITFDCFIADLDTAIPVQKEVRTTVKVKITGKVTAA